jgi:hypothetical protein
MRILVFTIMIILIILYINYYNGKQFKPCKTCAPNEIFYVDVQSPPYYTVQELYDEITQHGPKLRPEVNFNNAKGKKLSYSQLPEAIKKFYENDYLQKRVSDAVGENVTYADEGEEYRIFAKLYEDENDFIDWHYDNNFTVGNRYTLVVPILVDSENASQFMIKDTQSGDEKIVPIPNGFGVVYNGTITYHKITKQKDGVRRLVVVIPFYSNYKKTVFGHTREYFRNIAFQQLAL